MWERKENGVKQGEDGSGNNGTVFDQSQIFEATVGYAGLTKCAVDASLYIVKNIPEIHRFVHEMPVSQAIRGVIDKIF